MAQVTTIDKTGITGSDTFPLTANDVYKAVETLAVQNIRAVKSSNRIEDAFYEYEVENGKVIEEALIPMAEKRKFNKDTPDFSPNDPEVAVKYFNNWETAQFKRTIRRNDIRKIIANKGTGVEEVVSQILGSLTEGEGYDDYTKMRDIIKNPEVGTDASTAIFGGQVANDAKGIIYVLREMYNAIKGTNTLSVTVRQATPVEDIRIAISESTLNLIDVTELANTFNLSKEELFGKLVSIPYDPDYPAGRILVYDRKALGRGTRLFEYTQDILGSTLYTNHFLTTERCYFYNPLYKCLSIDVSQAVTKAKAKVLEAKAG